MTCCGDCPCSTVSPSVRRIISRLTDSHDYLQALADVRADEGDRLYGDRWESWDNARLQAELDEELADAIIYQRKRDSR